MTKVRKTLIAHNKYVGGALAFDQRFKIANPNFDWLAGCKVDVDYNGKTDTITVKRVKK